MGKETPEKASSTDSTNRCGSEFRVLPAYADRIQRRLANSIAGKKGFRICVLGDLPVHLQGNKARRRKISEILAVIQC